MDTGSCPWCRRWQCGAGHDECPKIEIERYDIFINAGPGCAMRAPGAVPGVFVLERAIDELAEKLELDPLTLRDDIDASPVRREDAARCQRDRLRPRHTPGVGAGRSSAGSGWRIALAGRRQTTHPAKSSAARPIRRVTRRAYRTSAPARHGVAQVVAEELGLRPKDIAVLIGDTDFRLGRLRAGAG